MDALSITINFLSIISYFGIVKALLNLRTLQYVAHFGESMQLVHDDFDFGNEISSNDRARSSDSRIQLGDNVNLEAVASFLILSNIGNNRMFSM